MRKTNDTKDKLAPGAMEKLVDVLRDHIEESPNPTDKTEEENLFAKKPRPAVKETLTSSRLLVIQAHSREAPLVGCGGSHFSLKGARHRASVAGDESVLK